MSAGPVERDPGLPARLGDRELALPSGEELVQLVRAELVPDGAPAPQAARSTYARWKPHTSLTACFAVQFEDGVERAITLKSYAGGKARALDASFRPDRYALEAAAPLRAFAATPAEGRVLYAFPCDRELDGVARLCSWKRTARRIDRLEVFPSWTVRRRASSTEVLRYKPERRAVLALNVKLRDESGERRVERLAGRVLPPAQARGLAILRAALDRAAEGPAVPRLLGHDAAPGILLEEWIPLEEVPVPQPAALGAAGELVGRLHALHRATRSPLLQPDLSGAHELLELDPRLGDLARELPRPEPLHAVSWIHGDYHLRQLGRRRDDGGFVMLDLDELRPGHPIEDLASCLADELALDPRLDPGALSEPLLSRHRSAWGQPLDGRALAEWCAIELARRAAGCLRRLEEGARERAAELLELARDVARDAGCRQ